jgi:hypothetical protein
MTTKETLASILEALEQLKDDNPDLQAAVGELTSGNYAATDGSSGDYPGRQHHMMRFTPDDSSPRSYASVIARSVNPSAPATWSTSGNTNDISSRDASPPGLTTDTRQTKDLVDLALENASDMETKMRARIRAHEILACPSQGHTDPRSSHQGTRFNRRGSYTPPG